MSKVFVIGNGFDLDLGLKTKYIDFWKSDVFAPFRDKHSGLIRFLNEKAESDATWFDIETLLREYVRKHSNRSAYDINLVNPDDYAEEQSQFNQIRESLSLYLEREIRRRDLKDDSAAAKVLKVVAGMNFTYIYSFNYTDLHKIADKLQVTREFEYKDIHGRSSDLSLILGINDDVEVVENYEFSYKTFSPHYHSVPLKFDLEEANEVVIFGLAMGDIDYPYFQDFFRNLCNPRNDRKDSKRITIFTYNEDSRLSILRRLRQMNEKRVNYMFGQNDFTLIRTSVEDDKPKLEEFLDRMKMEVESDMSDIDSY